MNIKFREIIDKGKLATERVVFEVLVDGDIGRYGVFRTGLSDSVITNNIFNAYWFPDKKVSSGDLVILYSKFGISSEVSNKDGSQSHFFYWGSEKSMVDDTHGLVLVSIPEWKVIK